MRLSPLTWAFSFYLPSIVLKNSAKDTPKCLHRKEMVLIETFCLPDSILPI